MAPVAACRARNRHAHRSGGRQCDLANLCGLPACTELSAPCRAKIIPYTLRIMTLVGPAILAPGPWCETVWQATIPPMARAVTTAAYPQGRFGLSDFDPPTGAHRAAMVSRIRDVLPGLDQGRHVNHLQLALRSNS
jgi:hypothetical protein